MVWENSSRNCAGAAACALQNALDDSGLASMPDAGDFAWPMRL
jgi:hypothetical protein